MSYFDLLCADLPRPQSVLCAPHIWLAGQGGAKNSYSLVAKHSADEAAAARSQLRIWQAEADADNAGRYGNGAQAEKKALEVDEEQRLELQQIDCTLEQLAAHLGIELAGTAAVKSPCLTTPSLSSPTYTDSNSALTSPTPVAPTRSTLKRATEAMPAEEPVAKKSKGKATYRCGAGCEGKPALWPGAKQHAFVKHIRSGLGVLFQCAHCSRSSPNLRTAAFQAHFEIEHGVTTASASLDQLFLQQATHVRPLRTVVVRDAAGTLSTQDVVLSWAELLRLVTEKHEELERELNGDLIRRID